MSDTELLMKEIEGLPAGSLEEAPLKGAVKLRYRSLQN
jgi:hypothetical protein